MPDPEYSWINATDHTLDVSTDVVFEMARQLVVKARRRPMRHALVVR